MSRRRLAVLLLAAFMALFIAWPALMSTLVDWWWFQEVGYQEVFTRQLVTRVVLFVLTGGMTGAILYGNLRWAQRGAIPRPLLVQMAPNALPIDVSRGMQRLAVPIIMLLAIIFGAAAGGAWDTILLALHATPFGTTDPIFGHDIGFYVFMLPAVSGVLGALLAAGILTLLLVIVSYFSRGDLVGVAPRQISLRPAAAAHIGAVLGALFVIMALQLWFVDVPSLVYSTTGPLVGASYTDMHATLPALRISAVLALVAAVWVVIGGNRGTLRRHVVQAVAGYALFALVGRVLYPVILQKVFVAPTELTRESPYLQNHLVATRRAWGLDSVEIKELGDAGNLTLADIQHNGPTIENIRLWDRDPLLQTFGQLQEIRTYYDFLSVDDDRYWIDGKYRQVLLSPRELKTASLPPQAHNFINEHLTFTHGMGLTLGPVNQVTSEGLPVLFLKDLPPASTVSLQVKRPQIYYGEMDYDYAVVGTREREFDHPAGDANVYAAYQGTGGVTVGNILRRLAFSTHFSTTNLLFSSNITDASRVLYNRNILQRAERALPFLSFDRDPYMVVAADGTLKWLLDAYTRSDAYPYAQHIADGTNYMRNSVKVVIDAYDGSVTAYVSVPSDPIIRTWSAIFPGILHSLSSMPADLRAHLRYPDELFTAQTALYATYHLDSPDRFYSREDQWQVPMVSEANGTVPFMRHIVMRLPEEKQAEFVYMVPYTPRGRENLSAWMVARNDGAEYGKLRVYTLSRQSLVFGPTQIENRINQNTSISQQVSLWDQRGSKVLRGDLLVIPIEQALLYVQPLYLQADGGRIPELKRVVVAYQNQVVMAETLDGALSQMFGGEAEPGAAPLAPVAAARPGVAADTKSLAVQAQSHYDAAMQAQRAGDWARYGDEIKQLGQLLERMRNQH
jgi:uncharacterized protein